MALPTFIADTAFSLDDMASDVARRQQGAGYPVAPRNAGNRRTDDKRALLAALETVGASW